MKKNQLIAVAALSLVIASCTQNNKEIPNDNLTVIEKPEVIEPMVEEAIQPIEEIDSVIKVTIPDSSELKKLEPIKSMPIVTVFANALPGLEGRIDLLNIPTEQQVGISSYPNAVIIQVDDKSEYKGKFYVSMELTTSDSVQQVLSYYKKEGANWTHIEKNGIHTFKMEEDLYFRETNTLQVLPLNKILYEEVDSLLGYEAKTLIRIYFEVESKVSNTKKLAYAAPING